MDHNIRRSFFLIVLPTVSFLLLSCNESLPVYVGPSNILSAEISSMNAPTDTVKYRMVDDNNPNLVAVRIFGAPLGFEIKIVNVYSETIQDDADVQGTLELRWADKQEFKTILPLAVTGVTSSQYDPKTGLITLNPGDTITLRTYWDYHFLNNDWAFTHAPYTDGPSYYYGKLTTAYDRTYDPLLLHGIVKVKLFRSLSFVDAETVKDIPILFKGQIISPP